ncbi:CopD family protein [Roseobacter weihaiensis]|uniref:CopD family protein n=1 Tax=Roseobacter weihaiensis TaxID=2763262 RepID=UPI001D0B9CC8|nr:CopD family protein [Roseobacter sp. H9]
MLDALVSANGITWLSICVKAMVYATTLWVVAGLFLAGLATLMFLTEDIFKADANSYTQFFMIKLVLFAAVLGLAARNKLQLTPALRQRAPGAAARMGRALRIEAAFLFAVLLVTAALSTVSAPNRASGTATTDRAHPPVVHLHIITREGRA